VTDPKETRVAILLEKLKNNKVISLIIVAGIGIVAIGQLTDALQKIEAFFSPQTSQHVSREPQHELPQEKRDSPIQPDEPLSPKSPSAPHESKGASYEVIVFLPSRMSGAEILVDGDHARVLEQTQTVARILVSNVQEAQTITAQKGNDSCSKKQMIVQDSTRIYLCQ